MIKTIRERLKMFKKHGNRLIVIASTGGFFRLNGVRVLKVRKDHVVFCSTICPALLFTVAIAKIKTIEF